MIRSIVLLDGAPVVFRINPIDPLVNTTAGSNPGNAVENSKPLSIGISVRVQISNPASNTTAYHSTTSRRGGITFSIAHTAWHTEREPHFYPGKGLTTLPSFRAITPYRKHRYTVLRFGDNVLPYVDLLPCMVLKNRDDHPKPNRSRFIFINCAEES